MSVCDKPYRQVIRTICDRHSDDRLRRSGNKEDGSVQQARQINEHTSRTDNGTDSGRVHRGDDRKALQCQNSEINGGRRTCSVTDQSDVGRKEHRTNKL